MSRAVYGSRRVLALAVILTLVAASCSEAAEEPVASVDVAAPQADNDAAADSTESDSHDTTNDGSGSSGSANETADVSDNSASVAQAAPTQDPALAQDDGSVVSRFAGEDWFRGQVPALAVPADQTLQPIRIGLINQEDSPIGSFPEVRHAAQAAVTFINTELGGVEGRPIELVTCITSFSPEQSGACARDMVQQDIVALVGGLDVTSNGSIPVLQQNGLPTLGGIPANLADQRSNVHFFFSGGTAGGMAAMIKHASNNGAETVMIGYGEFEPFEVAVRDYAAKVAESLGMTVELRPFPIIGADMLPVLTAAVTADVDALIINAADSACVPIMQGAAQLELRATVYVAGACAADAILEAAGADAAGVIFSSEGPAASYSTEGSMYEAVVAAYADGPAGGAGTVGFRGMMNVYAVLLDVGADQAAPDTILEFMQATVDRPSFWGHNYTCDGARIDGLPALCAPEQTLFTTTGNPADDFVFLPEGFEATDGWIEVDDLYAEALR